MKRMKWNDLPLELKNFFLCKLMIIISAVVAAIIFTIWSRLYAPGLFLMTICLVYAAYIGYMYYMTVTERMYIFEGVCESVSLKRTDLNIVKRNAASIYGNSTVTILIKDCKFVIPVPYNFSGEVGNTVRVYVLNGNVYEKTENSYTVNNPMLVKIVKI